MKITKEEFAKGLTKELKQREIEKGKRKKRIDNQIAAYQVDLRDKINRRPITRKRKRGRMDWYVD